MKAHFKYLFAWPVVFLLHASLIAQDRNVTFEQFTEFHGLASNIVNCIAEDPQYGYLWIGTEQGIDRFDGKEFYSIGTAWEDESLNRTQVISILIDKQNQIWLGTRNDGLFVLDPGEKEVLHFKHIPEDSTSLLSNRITNIFEDHKNNIWVCAKGLNQYNHGKRSFRRVIPFQDATLLIEKMIGRTFSPLHILTNILNI